MGFLGTCYHQVDAKNRIRIPARFKSSAPKGEALYFFKHREDCFAILPESSLNQILSLYGDNNPLSADSDDEQDALTYIYSMIDDVEEDNQGRVTTPKMFRDPAHLTKDNTEVTSIGRGNFIEVWAQSVFENKIARKSLAQSKAQCQAKKAEGNE